MDGFLVEPQNQGRAGLRESRVMSEDWRRLHRVRRVSSGSPENHWVPWLVHKANTKEPKTEVQQLGLQGVQVDPFLKSLSPLNQATDGIKEIPNRRGAKGL
jgi:hypothetical protein